MIFYFTSVLCQISTAGYEHVLHCWPPLLLVPHNLARPASQATVLFLITTNFLQQLTNLLHTPVLWLQPQVF